MKFSRSLNPLLRLGVLAFGLAWAGGVQAEEPSPTFQVLTYNIWGVFNAQYRELRLEQIPAAIIALNPDAVCLEECFRWRDLHTITNGLRELGYPLETVYQKELRYGSGVVILSRYPAELLEFEPFRIKGSFYSYERGAGRGVAHARLQTPAGPVDFFCTHAMPRMNLIFDEQGNYLDGDPKQDDRLLQMVEIHQIVERRRDPQAASVIVAGDFNVSPEMLEYQLLLRSGDFHSSFDELHPDENPSTYTLENEFATVEASRLDHILFRNEPGALGPRLAQIESRVVIKAPAPIPKLGRSIPLSDHYGLFTVFALRSAAETAPDAEPPSAQGRQVAEYYLPAVQSGVIEIVPENRGAWEALALAVLEDAIRRGKHRSPLIRPAAEIVAGWSEANNVQRVALDPEQQKALEKFLARSSDR
jgi:endonuclease/exonuclease/phosphatase family metal-dependent hydrolase